jgi:hypothetical protein
VNVSFDFTGPAVWTPPPCTVTPPSCYPEIVYTCVYISGPYTGYLDLCNFIGYFDVSTGTYVFNTNDEAMFPPGIYSFVMNISIGVTVVPCPFTITIIGHCDENTITIVNQPSLQHTYNLYDAAHTIFTFDINTLVHYTATSPCGELTVTWMTVDGFYLPNIFNIEVSITGIWTITVETDNVSMTGEYQIVFTVHYSGMPSVVVTSSVITVWVINPCIPPVDCINIPGCVVIPPVVQPPSINV